MKSLVPGDRIEIISTARSTDEGQLNFAKDLLEGWGFHVSFGKNIHQVHHQFCGTDEQRASDLQDAIDNPDVRAVLCFRGGYGTVRMLDLVNFSSLKENPKPIIGYSDITYLHACLSKNDIPSVHATMPVNFRSNTQEALASLCNALIGKNNVYSFASAKENVKGNAEGVLIGGNLSILYALAGTQYDYDYYDKILFIEDLDEYLYHIDRMLWNFKLSGKLDNLKAVIVGGMTDMNDHATPFGKNALEILQEHLSSLNIPVCFNFPAGHINDNRALIIGKKANIEIDEQQVRFVQ